MSEETIAAPPRSFWVIAVAALLWNLLGVTAYVMQVTMSEETLLAMSESERMLYANIPAWVMVVYAVAVFAGTLGSIFLLLRKAWAVPLYLVSLVAIILQMFHNLFIANTVEVIGAAAVVFPVLVVAIAILLVWYARHARRAGYIQA